MIESAVTLPNELLQNCKVLPSRADVLPLLPKDIVFAEIGVALGDFSRLVMNTCQVRHFYAIDIFTFHQWPDAWGGRVGQVFAGMEHRPWYEKEFAAEISSGRMTVMEGDSVARLQELPDESIDVAYVDADHAYEAVTKELSVIRRKIAPGGIIVLNDYTVFDQFRMVPYGVPRAAHEFMIREDWEMIYLALHPHMFTDIVIRKRV